MNDNYNMKEPMKEIFKTKGGKTFFDELNAARVPFFFIAAVENTEDKTEYFCETVTPKAMDICLTEDKFADHMNIQNHGFITVMDSNFVSSKAQKQKLSRKTSSSALPEEKGSETKESGNAAVSGLLDAMIKTVIRQQMSSQEASADDV